MRLLLWKTLMLLLVSVCGVDFTPGVQEFNRTYCSRNPTIHMNLHCDNSFLIGDECRARVNGHDTEIVLLPFKHDRNKGTMEVLQPVNFTHRSLCRLGDDKEMEKIENYKPINCTEPDSAAATQGKCDCGRVVILFPPSHQEVVG
ncbi:hypothetical protein NQD34_011601 [Periophthalmus magnuspinnatus]|nr:hypothetical protein NQD34_011601 [Periophthalmus magnuspinnatus]